MHLFSFGSVRCCLEHRREKAEHVQHLLLSAPLIFEPGSVEIKL